MENNQQARASESAAGAQEQPDSTPNKEQVYDEQIAPLMAQIIGICQERGIATLCTFAIPTPDDAGLACTTLLPDQDGSHPLAHRRAYREVMGRVQSVAITITSPEAA